MPNWKKVIVSGSNAVLNNITSSGNISSSGTVYAENVFLPHAGGINFADTNTFIRGGTEDINIDGDNSVQLIGDNSVVFNTPHTVATGFIQATSHITSSEVRVAGHITASGNISSSGDINGNAFKIQNLTIADYASGTGTRIGIYNEANSYRGRSHFEGHITASGNISSSGNIIANAYFMRDHIAIAETTNKIAFGFENNTAIQIGKAGNPTHIVGNITASGNISASGNLYGTKVHIPTNGHLYLETGNDASQYITCDGTTLQIKSNDLYHNGNSFRTSGHITASGNISANGIVTGVRLAQGSTLINDTFAPIAGGTGIETVGALNAGSITSGFTSIDVGSGAITTTGTATLGTIANVNTTNVTASGDISASLASTGSFGRVEATNVHASGTIEALGYKGTPIHLAHASQYIATTVANNYYYGNDTQGFFHHSHNAKETSLATDGSHTLGQGAQHNAILLPCDVKNIELRASARTNHAENVAAEDGYDASIANFAFWIMKSTRASQASSNPTLTFLASASAEQVIAENQHNRFHTADITGNHSFITNMTASAGEQLFVFFQPYYSEPSVSTKYLWTLSARTNE